MSELGVALIGAGGMGRSLGRQLRTIPGVRLVGIADPSPEALQTAATELEAPGFPEADAAINRPGVEAVVIASPPFEHQRLAEMAAAAGKHIFVEKPMAPTVAECDRMIAAAERAGVAMMVGQVLRYYPCWWQILELVRAGEIGEPWAVTDARIAPGWEGWPTAWRNSRAQSGGLLMEINSHEIDFMCQIGGRATRVFAEAEHFGSEDPSDYPNLCFVSLRFERGAIGMLHASTVSELSDLTGKVQGSEGTIRYTDGFGAGEIHIARRGEEMRTIPVRDIRIEQPVRKELRLFVEAIREGTPVPVPASEGRANVLIAEKAYESAQTGQAILLD